jgi:peptidoglycan/LPS O-acetylase OafA/YrhL
MAAARLRSIDFLRGIAALSVAFEHAVVAAPYTDIGGPAFARACRAVTDVAGAGVALFFVISGFCIHLNYARQTAASGRGTFQFGPFWRRRIWRLYPTYLFVLCLCMGTILLGYLAHAATSLWMQYPSPRLRWMGLDFLAHAFMLHGLYPLFDYGAGNPPFWTLAREEYLYLMYPLILVLSRRLSRLNLGILMCVMTVALGTLVPQSSWSTLIVTSAPALWVQWYLGSVAADNFCGLIRLPSLFRATWLVPFWIAAALYTPQYVAIICWGLAFFTLINACVAREAEGGWRDRSVARFFTSVGVFSYSLYLIHHPAQTLFLSLSLKLGRFSTPATFLLRAALMTVGSYFAARVLFALIESRFLFGRAYVATPSAGVEVIAPV